MRTTPLLARLVIALTLAVILAQPGLALLPTQAQEDPRYFVETQFLVDNEAIWSFFSQHGGERAFGPPVSRTFRLLGQPTQIFQRHVLRLTERGDVQVVGLLDSGWMPYNQIAGMQIPPYDPGVTSMAPPPDSPTYVDDMLAFVQNTLPDQLEGYQTDFYRIFAETVAAPDPGVTDPTQRAIQALQGLDVWGIPTSRARRESARVGIYTVRLERGVFRYDVGCGCVVPLPLGSYFKAIITGNDLPADLVQQAPDSPYLRQYDASTQGGPFRAAALPDTDLSHAFVPSLADPPVFGALPSVDSPPAFAPTSTPVIQPPGTPAPAAPTTVPLAAPSPINRPPYTLLLQPGEAGRQTTQMKAVAGEDARSLWQWVRYERDRDRESNGLGPNIIYNKIYVARSSNLARQIYGEEIGVRDFPESVDRYGAPFFLTRPDLGQESQALASCLEEGCNAGSYQIHLRLVWRNKNVVSVFYTYGDQLSSSLNDVVFLAKRPADRMAQ